MKIKRDKTDNVFSLCIRERSNWTCERCGKYFIEGSRQGLHCSHFYSRSYKGLRWFPGNACAHCFGCHQHLGGNPIEFVDFQQQYLGEEKFELLRIMARKPTKISKLDKEFIHKHLLSEHKKMLLLRSEGEVGRIEFSYIGE